MLQCFFFSRLTKEVKTREFEIWNQSKACTIDPNPLKLTDREKFSIISKILPLVYNFIRDFRCKV